MARPRAAWLALRSGPDRKPAYCITRKHTESRWYWRETLVQLALLLGLCAALVYGFVTQPVLSRLDLGSVYWALLSIILLKEYPSKARLRSLEERRILGDEAKMQQNKELTIVNQRRETGLGP